MRFRMALYSTALLACALFCRSVQSATVDSGSTTAPAQAGFGDSIDPAQWEVIGHTGAASVAQHTLQLSGDQGTVSIQSHALYQSGTAHFDFTANDSHWYVGVMSNDEKNWLVLRNDLPDGGVVLQVLSNGKEVQKQFVIAQSPSIKIHLNIEFDDAAMTADATANGNPAATIKLGPDQMPKGPFRLKLTAYGAGSLAVTTAAMDNAKLASASATDAKEYPSIWQHPTEVTRDAALSWGLSFQQLWCAAVPKDAGHWLEVSGPSQETVARTALLADRLWRPLAILPVQLQADRLAVALPDTPPTGATVLLLADGQQQSNGKSKTDANTEPSWPAGWMLNIDRLKVPNDAPPTDGSNTVAVRYSAAETARRGLSDPSPLARWLASMQLRALAEQHDNTAAAAPPDLPHESQFKDVGPVKVAITPGGSFMWNGVVGLALTSPEGGGGLRSLYCSATGRECISVPLQRPALWRLEYRRPDGTIATITNLDAAQPTTVDSQAAENGSTLNLTWHGVQLAGLNDSCDVTAKVGLSAGSPLSTWRISVVNHVKGAVLSKVVFPLVEHLGYDGESDALIHTSWSMMTHGELHRRATGLINYLYQGDPETSIYPCGSFPIQHLSVSVGANTVTYIAWHDPNANVKGYTYDASKELTCWGYPQNTADEGVNFESAYDTAIGPMPGDWFTAAQVYGKWAHQQPWCARGPKVTWPQAVKHSVLEVPYWARPSWANDQEQYDATNAQTMVRRVKNIEKWIGPPLAVHWYVWHHTKFDVEYPDYFPMIQGFADECRRETADDLTVFPYINGYWYSTHLPGAARAKSEAVVENPDGSLLLPKPANADPMRLSPVHMIMCPSSAWWRDQLIQIAQRLHSEGNVQGIYIDVTANEQPMNCYNRSHPHPPGRGSWWAKDLNQQISAIKSAPGSTPFVMSECFNEALGSSLDVNLTWTDRYPWSCPMIGSIYGGWLATCGSRVYENENIAEFTITLTRDTFWGDAMGGIINDWWAESDQTPYAKTVIGLAKFRRLCQDYLAYGEMQRPPELLSAPLWVDIPKWQADYKEPIPPTKIDAIERVAWRSPSGKYGLFVMNYTDAPAEAQFDLASVKALHADPSPQIVQLDGAGATVKNDKGVLTIQLPPRQPVLVVCGDVTKEQ